MSQWKGRLSLLPWARFSQTFPLWVNGNWFFSGKFFIQMSAMEQIQEAARLASCQVSNDDSKWTIQIPATTQYSQVKEHREVLMLHPTIPISDRFLHVHTRFPLPTHYLIISCCYGNIERSNSLFSSITFLSAYIISQSHSGCYNWPRFLQFFPRSVYCIYAPRLIRFSNTRCSGPLCCSLLFSISP